MTSKKIIMTSVLLTSLVALVSVSLVNEAFASCWWDCDNPKIMYYKIGYQHPCDNGGNCVTMSNSWQSLSSSSQDTIGIYTDKEYSWIRPIIQAETRDITAHTSWSAYTLAVDTNNSHITSDSSTFSKRYFYGLPQAETTFDRSDDTAPKQTLVTALISVTQISD